MNRDELNGFWGERPRMFEFKTPEPIPKGPVPLCEESAPFAEWCGRLISLVGDNPTAERVKYAKYKVLDRYCRYYHRTDPDHRPENNLDRHPCFHRVLLDAWDVLEDMDLRRGVPELCPPSDTPAARGSQTIHAVSVPDGGAVDDVDSDVVDLDAQFDTLGYLEDPPE